MDFCGSRRHKRSSETYNTTTVKRLLPLALATAWAVAFTLTAGIAVAQTTDSAAQDARMRMLGLEKRSPSEAVDVILKVRLALVHRPAQSAENPTSSQIAFRSLPGMSGVYHAVVTARDERSLVSALAGERAWELLAESELHAASGRSAVFKAWGEDPASDTESRASVRLQVTPTVLYKQRVQLGVSRLPDEPAYGRSVGQPVASGMVSVQEGQWLVLSGLFPSQAIPSSGLQIPLIGEIPGINPLLAGKPAERAELMVLIRPLVIRRPLPKSTLSDARQKAAAALQAEAKRPSGQKSPISTLAHAPRRAAPRPTESDVPVEPTVRFVSQEDLGQAEFGVEVEPEAAGVVEAGEPGDNRRAASELLEWPSSQPTRQNSAEPPLPGQATLTSAETSVELDKLLPQREPAPNRDEGQPGTKPEAREPLANAPQAAPEAFRPIEPGRFAPRVGAAPPIARPAGGQRIERRFQHRPIEVELEMQDPPAKRESGEAIPAVAKPQSSFESPLLPPGSSPASGLTPRQMYYLKQRADEGGGRRAEDGG